MKTQAMGWLVAGVLAAGLNASYHDGGLQWAHRIADQIENRANVVLALAHGRTDEAIAEASWMTSADENSEYRLDTALAHAQAKLASSNEEFNQLQALSNCKLARLQANRARVEARVSRVRVPTFAFTSVSVPSVHVSACPRVRVSVPRISVPATPVVHVEVTSPGPV